ncbi:MAG: phosphoglucosamine mutase [Thermoplasmata archaeon]
MTKLFGTNGVRGVVNETMTVELAGDLSRAIGTFFGGGKVAIGCDTRTSADMLKSASISGLLSAGCSVVDLGTVPSPTLQFEVKKGDYSGGIIITASHNPPEFNGIKCVDSDGLEMDKAGEEAIEEIYFSRKFQSVEWKNCKGVLTKGDSIDNYVSSIVNNVDAESVGQVNLKVVLDCGNGATCLSSPKILNSLGCEPILLNETPDGTFPGHDSEPIPENLSELMRVVVDSGAAIGIAHDGDGDRTIFIDENGNYIYGDKTLALMARRIVEERLGGLVVTPVSSSSCVEEAVKKAGGEVKYTAVGSPIVARVMRETGAVFGGEENGGLIFPEHQFCRDGGMAMAKVLELLALSGEKFSRHLKDVPVYHTVKKKVHCPNEKKVDLLEGLARRYEGEEVDTTDGVKVLYSDGWVLIRPSGTEPLFRIFAESKLEERAKELVEEGVRVITDLIESTKRDQ